MRNAALSWPRMTVWMVVNAVCWLQAIGFATRTMNPDINRWLGLVIVALVVPSTVALAALLRRRAGWRELAGPTAFGAFVVFAVIVDYWLRVEFRQPGLPAVLFPYLVLFFGSIALMGMPMFRIDRRLWGATAVSATALVLAMAFAMSRGVG